MTIIAEILISLALIAGSCFALVGTMGLIKLQNTMQRLHAPTKATTLGIAGVLIASVLYFLLIKGKFSFHEILIVFFLFLTAPITANFIAKVFIQANVRRGDLPETGNEHGWAVYDDPPAR